jgi:hypothetical protein
MSAFQPLQAFLNSVKHDPVAFAIPLVAHLSIFDSLWEDFAGQPFLTQSPLALLAWAINVTVWCMHCNNVRATRHTNIVANYDLYLSHVAASLKRADDNDKLFGKSPPVLNPILLVLHPPCHTSQKCIV